ncbi:head GIN domain-containing protein [uncultured Lacinutrix sp.]|uniref:head GIN domain-containing protein n=1 Tax=uncultured Lacinutrix sp. TaxID=574032 RepID=UPI0026114745|nr:head GIN domain-containing protein [uncultured Lacinutrix sp.]
MKKLLYIFTVLTLVGCDSENAPDCFQNTGDIIQKEFTVGAFTKITAFKNVELIVTDDTTQSVVVETGENLLNDVKVTVENGRLLLKDENGCNLTRDYGITKIYVSASNITEIRNSSQFTVRSNGVLNYSDLKLISEDDSSSDFGNVGIFDVEVNANSLFVVINNLTTTYVSGTVNNLKVNHASGDGRFEGRNLIAQNADIYHRGTNDIIINPQVSLEAELVSTGDVIVVNTPPTLDIQEEFTGRVIFE